MIKSRTLAQANLQLQTKEGIKEMLFREVVTSSKIEGIKNAKAVLTKWYKTESSLNQCIAKKSSHKLPVYLIYSSNRSSNTFQLNPL